MIGGLPPPVWSTEPNPSFCAKNKWDVTTHTHTQHIIQQATLCLLKPRNHQSIHTAVVDDLQICLVVETAYYTVSTTNLRGSANDNQSWSFEGLCCRRHETAAVRQTDCCAGWGPFACSYSSNDLLFFFLTFVLTFVLRSWERRRRTYRSNWLKFLKRKNTNHTHPEETHYAM